MGWAFLPNLGSGGLLVMIRGLLAMVTGGLGRLRRRPWFWALVLCASWPGACGLGQDSALAFVLNPVQLFSSVAAAITPGKQRKQEDERPSEKKLSVICPSLSAD